MNLTLQGWPFRHEQFFSFFLFFLELLSCIKLLTTTKFTFHIGNIMILIQETYQRKFVPSRGFQWHSKNNHQYNEVYTDRLSNVFLNFWLDQLTV
jgi:hypothetical protein